MSTQCTLIQKVSSTYGSAKYRKQNVRHNGNEINQSCFLKFNYSTADYFTIYTSGASRNDNKTAHFKHVNDCVLKEILKSNKLDTSAHFVLITYVNSTWSDHYESKLIVFTSYDAEVYQKEILLGLQKENRENAIHCSKQTHYSIDTMIQLLANKTNIDIIRIYSNCRSCLDQTRALITGREAQWNLAQKG